MSIFNKKKASSSLPPLQERLPLNNAIAIEALVNVLERKNVLNKKELLEEVRKLAKTAKQQTLENWNQDTDR